ncbi:TPA: hypothetical protein ACXEZG_004810, partial [Escherichia coli]
PEQLHEVADERYQRCRERFGDDGITGLSAPGDGHSLPVSGCREPTSPSGRVRGFRGEALNQSRSDSGVYTGLTMRHQCRL